ncbi:hypothetical protein J4E90_008183 [Alternaria incomplexa]|uniref:uncharacterized protein n=1 Tax=Alternaria incomplexa TaxID=1187928 RepID=UPI0022210105|nr:uncharacterized protein J4E90_008183 [Alternaria incomplexa]KAI4909486.1 hypothetical protein J4E90_008183 [Alternaria incomplexa]
MGLIVLNKYLAKSLQQFAEQCEREEAAIELAQSQADAMEEGEEKQRAVVQLAVKLGTRFFESLVEAARHDGLQELVETVEEIVQNHVPNEADAAHL